ncbi:DUF3889 domain-containing protein [Paenibacillus antri]|uniref:DUF3889 domain-containing protein n=1 Tax=Paenibacillus antri TaxID=2582848 RepID=A0A5R9FZ38_9BACL|nr:DUF3889 domain-containing protein [Paenibacillus antri]TLS49327.1 DUF3889 domain-containing protein [Paenibacillus antri]
MRTILLKWSLYVLAVGLILPACNAQPRMQAEGNDVAARTIRNEPVELYGPWGRFGLEETRRRFPNAQIVDYEHMGRDAVETFHYALREGGREFVVEVRIAFDPETNRVIAVDVDPLGTGLAPGVGAGGGAGLGGAAAGTGTR